MKAINLEDALQAKPFRPFVVELDNGKQIRVVHEDFLFLSPSKGTVLIWETKEDGDHYFVVDVENISALSFVK